MSEEKLTRKEQARETKQHLFDVALNMLAEKPFEQITVRDIVKEAGVSTGTFYLYYPTKLDVFYETYVIADEYFNTTVRKRVSKLKSTESKIRCFFTEYGAYSSELTSLKLTKLLYNSDNKCFIRNVSGGMHDLLTDIIQEGIDNGFFAEDDAEKTADRLMIIARGRTYDWCIHDGSYNLKKAMVEDICRLLCAFRPGP